MAEYLLYVEPSARVHLVLCNLHILSHSTINVTEKDEWMNKLGIIGADFMKK